MFRAIFAILFIAFVLALPASANHVPTGVFDTGCSDTNGVNHSLADDPLLFPGQPGAAHMHDFFGNNTTDAFSTGQTLLDANVPFGAGTDCKDIADGAAYWVPALYKDGAKINPLSGAHIYYRASADPALQLVQPFPVGFGMISDDYFWACSDKLGVRYSVVVDCPTTGVIIGVVSFDRCWNGVDLFRADQSHTGIGKNGDRGCLDDPAHPVLIPKLQILVKYRIGTGTGSTYTLSSGPTSTYHADFLNAWNPARLQHLIDKCLNVRPSPSDCKNDANR